VAILARLISASPDGPSLLLPVFRTRANSNSEIVQNISFDDKVLGFQQIDTNPETGCLLDQKIEVFVGDKALWAFRRQDGGVHIGDHKSVSDACLKAIDSGIYKKYPVRAAEIVLFCRAESRFQHILTNAFDYLLRESEKTAYVWRDAAIFTPAVKADIDKYKFANIKEYLESAFVFTKGNICHVFVHEKIIRSIDNLDNLKLCTRIFGIKSIRLHDTKKLESHSREIHTWSLLGIGSIAHRVVRRYISSVNINTVAITQGSNTSSLLNDKLKLIVGIIGSDINHADKLSFSWSNIYNRNRVTRHIINVRPVGYGSPSQLKSNPLELRHAIPQTHCMWILAGHRLRKPRGQFSSLSGASLAGSMASAATQALITAQATESGQKFLEHTYREPGLGIVGVGRFDRKSPIENSINRALFNASSEDTDLKTSERITAFVPGNVFSGKIDLKFGGIVLNVNLVEVPSDRKTNNVVVFCHRIANPDSNRDRFVDLCIRIADYEGWSLERYRDQFFTIRQNTITYHVYPLFSKNEIGNFSEMNSKTDFDSIFVTRFHVNEDMQRFASSIGFYIVHYSDFASHMLSLLQLELPLDESGYPPPA
jgi:hypothetical protein